MLDAVASQVPTFGNVFIVTSSSDAADDRVSRLQEVFKPYGNTVRIFSSLSDANSAITSNNNDVVVLDGDSTHSLSAMLTVSANRCHFFGIEHLMGIRRRYGQRSKVSLGVTTAATDIATVKVTGVGCSFHGIKFMNSNTVTEGIYCFADAGEYTYLENCEIYKDTDLDQTGAAELVANGDSSHYKDCTIGSLVNAISGAVIRPCVTFSRGLANTGAVARDVTFEGCLFWRNCGNTGNRFVYGAEANAVERMGLFKDCVFVNAKLATQVPAQNVAFGATLTDGEVLLWNCSSMNAATAMSTTTGVFVDSPVPTAGTSGISVQAS